MDDRRWSLDNVEYGLMGMGMEISMGMGMGIGTPHWPRTHAKATSYKLQYYVRL